MSRQRRANVGGRGLPSLVCAASFYHPLSSPRNEKNNFDNFIFDVPE
jgi:hypothetical protein